MLNLTMGQDCKVDIIINTLSIVNLTQLIHHKHFKDYLYSQVLLPLTAQDFESWLKVELEV